MDEQGIGTAEEHTSLVDEPGVGLTDLVQSEIDPASGSNSNVHGKDGSPEDWFWVNNGDQVIEGSGEPPVWYNSKTFKSVEDQAKAHPELRKLYNDKLKGLSGAPEEGYKYDMPEDFAKKGYEYNTENPYYQDFLDLARTNGVSQELVEQMTDLLVESENVSRETFSDRQEETQNQHLNELTNGDREGFEQAVRVASNNPNVDKGALNVLLEELNTSDAIKAFTALVSPDQYSRLPGPEVASVRDSGARQNQLRERLAGLQHLRGKALEDEKSSVYAAYADEYPGEKYFG